MDEKAARGLFKGGRTDILISVGDRVWWWTLGFGVLVALSGPGCGSNLLAPTAVDSGTASIVDSGVECAPYLTQRGDDTGLDVCSNGNLQRRASIQCPWPAMGDAQPCSTFSACASDDDCVGSAPTAPKGYCAQAHNLVNYCGCFMGCREDADCGPGWLCQCSDSVVGQCVRATCATNADCGAGLACVRTLQGTPGGTCNPIDASAIRFVCQTAADSCRGSTDCTDAGTHDGGEIVVPTCLYDGSRRACGVTCRGI